ncbi:hypothetical protein BD626DRAFT_149900 [Schizophyllum amplum]|uniref:Acetoin reductase family protein n=1 Tax=Schizophyllum amplum TaxID=97359 RepID=A0A550C408_9AGAR|nr:hypothetical protein BD626DRAFT_149900 [Auriculariopsis ampla]
MKDHLEGVRQEVEAKGRKALIVLGDVSSEPDVIRLVDETAEHFGRLDAMIANAGIMFSKPLVETTVEEWHHVHKINGLGLFLCYKHAAIKMQQLGTESGRIVGASSVAGKVGEPFCATYSQTKFGVRGLTQALAGELANTGITVNCYCPGAIDTNLLRELGEGTGDKDKLYADEKNKTMVGRLGTPEDISNVVSFLVSPKSQFITGQSIHANGGRVME